MAQYNTAVSPLLLHWRICSLALSHWYIYIYISASMSWPMWTSTCITIWRIEKKFQFQHHEFKWRLDTYSTPNHYLYHYWFNSLRLSDAIWRHRSRTTLAQVMACCLTAPSHYLNQCWLIATKVYWYSSEDNFTTDTPAISCQNYSENYSFKISFKSPRGQWVNLNEDLWRAISNETYILWGSFWTLLKLNPIPPGMNETASASFTLCCNRKTSNIRRTLVGACRRCSNYIFILDLTSGFNGFGKDTRKTVRESFKCWDLVRLILETRR